MPPVIALMLCVTLVAALLRIERKWNPEASWALWLPTFLLLICGSRSLGSWFEMDGGADAEAGSSLDQLVLSTIILLSFWVLFKRKLEWSRILKDNYWLIVLYLYLGLSILWSDFQFVSFRRWIRLVGVIPIALVILVEHSPFKALESVFRRCAYVLIPFSLMLCKYYLNLGVQFDRWTGTISWVGVSTQKNGLGQICAIFLFFMIWATLPKWRLRDFFKFRPHVLADVLVISIGILLLRGPGNAFSATAVGVFFAGTIALLLFYRREHLTKAIANQLKVIVIVSSIGYFILGNTLIPEVTSLFGRNDSFTGRTEIWHGVLEIASKHPLLGTGYGGFWGLGDDPIFYAYGVRQAHNGYLGVYLEVGIIGIVVFSAFLLSFCDRIRRELYYEFHSGVSGLCFLLMLLLYNFTEDTYLKSSFVWTVTVFMTIVLSEPYMHQNEELPIE